MRNYAALSHEYLEEMAELDDAEFGRLARALLKYSMTGEVVELPGNERFYYRRVINQENRHQQSYEVLCEKRRQAGKKGAASRWGEQADGKNGNTKTETEIKTKTETDTETNIKTKNNALSSKDEKSGASARMRRDMEALAALERKEREAHEQAESGLVGVCQAYDPAVPGQGQ